MSEGPNTTPRTCCEALYGTVSPAGPLYPRTPPPHPKHVIFQVYMGFKWPIQASLKEGKAQLAQTRAHIFHVSALTTSAWAFWCG